MISLIGLTGVVSADGGGNSDGRGAALGGKGVQVRGIVVLVLELSYGNGVSAHCGLRVREVVRLYIHST